MPRSPKDKPQTPDFNSSQSVDRPDANPSIQPQTTNPDQPVSPNKPIAIPPVSPQVVKKVVPETNLSTQHREQRSTTEATPPQNLKRIEKRLPVAKPLRKQDIPVIDRAIAASGEVFNIGDRIQITEPYGNPGQAVIEAFYADAIGEIWAHVKPVEVNPNYRWEQGCIRAQRLVKV